jgi:aryl-alcohol dehydrogenase-like predicted oxidoreductase
MERAYLGGSGVCVSRVILGCGNFGGIGSSPAFFGRGETRAEAFALMDAAWEAGITTFDTADAYGGGRSETWIGDWLATKGPEVREGLVLSTKTFNPMDEGADSGLAPARIRRQLESSLRRLRVERVGLYLTHDWDPDVPIAETLGTFDELQHEGKFSAYGASNVDATQLRQALAVELPTRYEWVQNAYSLLEREAERGVLPLCAEQGLGFTPFSPLAGGWLTGKYERGAPPPAGSRMTTRPEPYLGFVESDAVWRGLAVLSATAAELGTSPATLALAWLLDNPHVTGVVVGPRRPEQLEPALAALELRPGADALAAVSQGFLNVDV